MTTNTLSLLERCKDALEEARTYDDSLAKWERIKDCITDLEAAIAAERSKEQAIPQQEPSAEVVAITKLENHSEGLTPRIVALDMNLTVGEKLYTSPQPLKPLSDEDIEALFQSVADSDDEVHIRFARAIEAKRIVNEVTHKTYEEGYDQAARAAMGEIRQLREELDKFIAAEREPKEPSLPTFFSCIYPNKFQVFMRRKDDVPELVLTENLPECDCAERSKEQAVPQQETIVDMTWEEFAKVSYESSSEHRKSSLLASGRKHEAECLNLEFYELDSEKIEAWTHGCAVALAAYKKLYTSPQPLKPLSDEEIKSEAIKAGFNLTPTENMLYTVRGNHAQLEKLTRAIEAKLGVGK